MALRQEDSDNRGLYAAYVQALQRRGAPAEAAPAPSPGHAIRHCATCGETTMFRLDPEGTWYECLRCGHYA